MVLAARYKAEKIEYPVVGEKTKESSDVIDYNINEEITKDTSAEFNANNDTTTGMANVIPGINAPKLRADTSIAGGTSENIIIINDYLDKDERQPVVDRVLAGEWLCVRCIFKAYAQLTRYFFLPTSYTSNILRFQCIAVTQQRMRINCNLSNGIITSITTSNGSM